MIRDGLSPNRVALLLRVGGSVPVVWSYFVEFAPNRYRGGMLSCLAAFWMIGQLIVTGDNKFSFSYQMCLEGWQYARITFSFRLGNHSSNKSVNSSGIIEVRQLANFPRFGHCHIPLLFFSDISVAQKPKVPPAGESDQVKFRRSEFVSFLLLQKGRHDEALEVLRKIYYQNKGKFAEDFPVSH